MEAQVSKWVNGPDYDFAVAGVIFATPDGNLILHHRDGNTQKSPNLLSFFGGRLEPEDETPADGAAREASEETNRVVTPADIEPFTEYTWDFSEGEVEKIYLFLLRDQTTDGLEVYEGQGYQLVTSPDDPLIAPVAQAVVTKWFSLTSAERASTLKTDD